MPITAPIKRGDTIIFAGLYTESGVPANLTAYDIRSQVRNYNGRLIDTLAITRFDQSVMPGQFSMAATKLWPVGVHQCDIVFSCGGQVRTSETFDIEIIRGVTAL